MNLNTLFRLLTAGLFTVSAQAALYDRGNGLIYDDVLDITWLQDANYAQTSGYDSDGKMIWGDANAWAAGLSYGGFDDWRLPSILNVTIDDYNVAGSEMGHMFYNNLGNQSNGDTGCTPNCFTNMSFVDATPGSNATVSFTNVMSHLYWYEEEYEPADRSAWSFVAYNGYQNYRYKGYRYYAWAVRDGDVNEVPVPGAAWLFSTALLVMVGAKRRHY